MLCWRGGAAAFSARRPLHGGRHVAWDDPDHPGDHLPARRLQRPVRRLWLWHGPFRNGARRRRTGCVARPALPWQLVHDVSRCNKNTYFLTVKSVPDSRFDQEGFAILSNKPILGVEMTGTVAAR